MALYSAAMRISSSKSTYETASNGVLRLRVVILGALMAASLVWVACGSTALSIPQELSTLLPTCADAAQFQGDGVVFWNSDNKKLPNKKVSDEYSAPPKFQPWKPAGANLVATRRCGSVDSGGFTTTIARFTSPESATLYWQKQTDDCDYVRGDAECHSVYPNFGHPSKTDQGAVTKSSLGTAKPSVFLADGTPVSINSFQYARCPDDNPRCKLNEMQLGLEWSFFLVRGSYFLEGHAYFESQHPSIVGPGLDLYAINDEWSGYGLIIALASVVSSRTASLK